MEKTTLYLTEEIRQQLSEVSRRSGESQAVIVRRALREYLDRQERPSLRSVGIGKDEGMSGRDSEDWLNSEWGRGV